jgi:ABC transporter
MAVPVAIRSVSRTNGHQFSSPQPAVGLRGSAARPDTPVISVRDLRMRYGQRDALTGLDADASKRAAQLSGGQRRKLDLALALTGRPQVLFLDEPTTGFDPAARRDAWASIAALKDTGTTIILTTHYMEEAERLADRAAVISAGALVSEGSPGSLVTSQATPTIAFSLPAGVATDDLPEPARQAAASAPGGKVTLPIASPLPILGALAGWAERTGTDLPDLEVRRPTLEDAYLQLTSTPRRRQRRDPPHPGRPYRSRPSRGHPAHSRRQRGGSQLREAALPRPARLAAHQFRYDLLAFFRNIQARFFTLALPHRSNPGRGQPGHGGGSNGVRACPGRAADRPGSHPFVLPVAWRR